MLRFENARNPITTGFVTVLRLKRGILAIADDTPTDRTCAPVPWRDRRHRAARLGRRPFGLAAPRMPAVLGPRPQGALTMGKRSSFERREADFYPTPRAAVVPLIPYLARHPHLCRAVCRRWRAGPAPGILRPALRLCRRHPHRPGCACARPLRRGRCDHHEPALHPRADAQADPALPAHCADLAVTRLRLVGDQAGGSRTCPTARTS